MSLRSNGYEVATENDGTDALEFAKKESVNLVITDLHMPEMDGISLVKELRKLDDYRFIPIIFLTTESGEDFKKRGKEAGATGWIVKPFVAEKLLSVINKVIG